jgi:hypothetical protein
MSALLLLADLIMFSTSGVSIEPSEEPNVVAIVTFANSTMNDEKDQVEKFLTVETERYGEVVVPVVFGFNVDREARDSIKLTPLSWIICVPVSCEVAVLEHTSAQIKLIEYTGL